MPYFSRRQVMRAAAGVATLPLLARAARADTLQDIRKSGVLKAGCQVAQVPWGFSDDKGVLTGFDV